MPVPPSWCDAHRSDEIVDRTIDNVMEIYPPEMVHLGHDEVWDLGTCSRCLESGKEGGELALTGDDTDV